MPSVDNFYTYLDRYDVPIEEIWSHVEAIDPGATVVATGSVPRGLGNRYSDIDILLLGESAEMRLRERFHFDHGAVVEHVSRLSSGHEINVFTIAKSAVDEFRSRLSECGNLIRDPSGSIEGIPLLTRPGYRLLDDIATGVTLRGGHDLVALRETLLLDDIPAHVMMLALTEHLVTREDAIGHIERGSCESGLLLIREAIVHLSEAILASAGVANTRLQWRFALLESVQSVIGEDCVARIKDFLLRPEADTARVTTALDQFVQFSDQQLGLMLGRVAHLAPAFMKLSEHQSFQTAPKAR